MPVLLRRHPGKTLGMTVFGLVLVGIVANATVLQKGHHPAPLFGGTSHATASVPVPPSRPADPTTTASLPPAQGTGRPAVSRKADPPSSADAASPPSRKSDGIGRLLQDHPEDSSSPATSDRSGRSTLLTAQRALASLGYPVTLDGKMGEATRRALAAFQRDHHLEAGEALTPKLLRELAAAASVHRG